MTSSDMLSINNVAAKLGLSVHQLRRWELMFGLEIKRGRGQQRQYREEDMSVLERIKELVEQGWPTSQIRPQLEAEGLLTPKLIGAPPVPGNPEVLQEAIIGLRNFSERRFIDLSKQIDELRQLLISVTLKQELSTDRSSPWQPMASEYVPAPKAMPPQEITIGPQISIDPPKSQPVSQSMMGMQPGRVNQIPPNPSASPSGSPYAAPPASMSSTPNATTSATPTTPGAGISPNASASDFSQRSMLGGSVSGGSTESKPIIPDIDQAPKPITDALQRSMSTLDSLFKDQRNTPGLGADQGQSSMSSSATSSTTSSSSLPASGPAAPPVRYSTIPPLPLSPTTSTTSASQTPAVNPASSAPYGSNPNIPSGSFASGSASSSASSSTSNPAVSSSSNPAVSSSGNPAVSSSGSASGGSPAAGFAGQQPAYPGYSSSPSGSPMGTSTGSSTGSPAVGPQGSPAGAVTPTSGQASGPSSGPSASAGPPTAWDQAFASTSVDIDAVTSSGLFDVASAAGPSSSDYGSERNPFTTVTGTNTSALDSKPTDSQPPLMGQTDASSQGFNAVSSTSSGEHLTQTGPLPAHTSVESFAPEQKEKMISSQLDSTSTDLPQTDPAGPAEPPAPAIQPALPLTTGPQVNFGPNVSAPTPQVTPQRVDDNFGLGEVTDQNYLTVLGRALDLIGWSDEQADSFSLKTFGVPHWDELGRSQAEKLVAHLVGLLKDQLAQ